MSLVNDWASMFRPLSKEEIRLNHTARKKLSKLEFQVYERVILDNQDVFVPFGDEGALEFYCPGCKRTHLVCYEHDSSLGTLTMLGMVWRWNGSLEKPTTTPSWLFGQGNSSAVCHSFITDGHIQFLGDCTHELAGQTVKLEPPPKEIL